MGWVLPEGMGMRVERGIERVSAKIMSVGKLDKRLRGESTWYLETLTIITSEQSCSLWQK